jgi:hypothetical protein
MAYALFGLIYSSLNTFLLLLGLGTAINKSGRFFKTLENEENDNFKKAFDKTANEIIEDFNNSFESINLISVNVSKILILFYELMIGDKMIKKTKDGKIVVDDKNNMFEDYKNKINNLNNKIKNYKLKLKENNQELDDEEDDDEEQSNDENEEIEEVNAE